MSLSISRGIQSTSKSRAINVEHAQFMTRNKVDPTFSGPVFSTETIYVPCGYCGTPVDPVARVPVGRMFFHPHCLRCAICGKVQSRTLPFVARQGQPVCQNCDRNKSVTLPPLKAAAFAERAKASINGVGTLRSIMERCATRSPTRRGHAIEMRQLALQSSNDPNMLLISAERQHELDAAMAHQSQTQQRNRAMHLNSRHNVETALIMGENANANNNSSARQNQNLISYQDYKNKNSRKQILPLSNNNGNELALVATGTKPQQQ
jgi:hypothetical protein